MQFADHIFISYAHIDDRSPIEGRKGWVSSFHHALETRVTQLLGKETKIWRDPELHGNEYFTEILLERFPGVAVLVAVLSPRYTLSDWCTREIREFYRTAEERGGVRIADRARLFKVVKTPVPLEKQPQELREMLGYEFFTTDPQSGRARELNLALGPEATRQFLLRVDDVSNDIVELLEMLDNGDGLDELAHDVAERLEAADGDADRAPSTSPLPEELSVYVAETSFDLGVQRDDIRRDLKRRGYRVLPDRPLPLLASKLESEVRRQLGECRMSIHPIGGSYGVVPDGAQQSVVALQNELAIERSAGVVFPRLIWMPPGLDVSDERQRGLVEQLESDPRIQLDADVLEIPLEDFKTVVERQLEELKQPIAPPAEKKGPVTIYLVCDEPDLANTAPLEDFLFDRGYEIVPSVFDGDEAQVRVDHQESLCLCDAVLVYYGAGSELWLRRKLRELLKSAGFGRQEPFLAKVVYVAPPATAAKKRLRTHDAEVIRASGEFEPSALKGFLRQIERAGSERS